METYQKDITLFGFFPVTVSYTVQEADPGVGIMESYIDDWEIIYAPLNAEYHYSDIEELINRVDPDNKELFELIKNAE